MKLKAYPDEERRPGCDEHAADGPALVGGRLVQRRLALLGVDHVQRPLRRLGDQEPQHLLVAEPRAVVQGRLARLVDRQERVTGLKCNVIVLVVFPKFSLL